jgi:hypothetical protein
MSDGTIAALISATAALVGAILGSASAVVTIAIQHRLSRAASLRSELRSAYAAWFYGCMRALADQIELKGACANTSIASNADVIVPLAVRARESMHLRAQATANLALLERSRRWVDRVVTLTETDWFFKDGPDPHSTFKIQEDLAKTRERDLLAFIHEVRENHPYVRKW